MKQRLIDANKLKAHYASWGCESANDELKEYKKVLDILIDLQPTVEAEPIRHGKWIELLDDPIHQAKCSVCGWKAAWDANDISNEPYCPHCGARLEVLS